MIGYFAIGLMPIGASGQTVDVEPPDRPGLPYDIPEWRRVVFKGTKRTVVFEGTERVAVYEGFERIVRF
jgi:hypothetical protein